MRACFDGGVFSLTHEYEINENTPKEYAYFSQLYDIYWDRCAKMNFEGKVGRLAMRNFFIRMADKFGWKYEEVFYD